MSRLFLLLIIPFLLGSASFSLQAQETPKPPKIFTDEDVISAEVIGPWRDIGRQKQSGGSWEGSFRYTDAAGSAVEIPVTITTRGLTRLRVCDFPPLRLAFDKEAAKGTRFRGAGSLKLVTHCLDSARYQQYYIKEYLAYRIYNRLSDLSFRVQGLDLTYTDSNGKGRDEERFAFLIEDPDDVAKRNDLEKLDVNDIEPVRLDSVNTSKFMLFQYLISNLDWSALSGPKGRCCHNGRLMGENADATPLFIVPYDLDSSGLVDAHYAAPPANIRVNSVKQRLYRGFCVHNPTVKDTVEELRALRPEINALFVDEPRLDERQRKNAIKFLDRFYKTLENDKDIEKQLIGNCRG